ncbi:uncharacterized protein BDZ99DRAFT_460917 [Mytilinidion resinicola]|uniref:2,5-diamino-6-ribosylamino-4(3H)-pyrimidinone 5'-phosphate reductase n=1 Tax=Mytilinidion resinicola TaxID=574789 RepID=A0A6A6YVX2_9PEZI|nr:uncharacterized protein BDZ99DRAFT_460917 [Mytilinidion resinicola]KAF2812144.1 hypothetical protein BDZ99DRAFT_460917 [Mytilinidion resinicola]
MATFYVNGTEQPEVQNTDEVVNGVGPVLPPIPRYGLQFHIVHRLLIEPHLQREFRDLAYPFTTLTFATSLDSSLALSPGTQTALSGPESKAMTHYLRSRHDAILVGVGTAIADDPSLNCRLEGVGGYGGDGLIGQPRPIILDPNARWDFSEASKVMVLAARGQGKAPYIICLKEPPEDKRAILESVGGKFIRLSSDAATEDGKVDWQEILWTLTRQGIKSVMIEGGGTIINDLLEVSRQHLVDSIIVTVAPTWLGQGGVVVSPPRRIDADGDPVPALKLKDVKWFQLGDDMVLLGRPSDSVRGENNVE